MAATGPGSFLSGSLISSFEHLREKIDNQGFNHLPKPTCLYEQIGRLLENMTTPMMLGVIGLLNVFDYSPAYGGVYTELLLNHINNQIHTGCCMPKATAHTLEEVDNVIGWILKTYIPRRSEISSTDSDEWHELIHELRDRENSFSNHMLQSIVFRKEDYSGVLAVPILAGCVHTVLLQELLILDPCNQTYQSQHLFRLVHFVSDYHTYIFIRMEKWKMKDVGERYNLKERLKFLRAYSQVTTEQEDKPAIDESWIPKEVLREHKTMDIKTHTHEEDEHKERAGGVLKCEQYEINTKIEIANPRKALVTFQILLDQTLEIFVFVRGVAYRNAIAMGSSSSTEDTICADRPDRNSRKATSPHRGQRSPDQNFGLPVSDNTHILNWINDCPVPRSPVRTETPTAAAVNSLSVSLMETPTAAAENPLSVSLMETDHEPKPE